MIQKAKWNKHIFKKSEKDPKTFSKPWRILTSLENQKTIFKQIKKP